MLKLRKHQLPFKRTVRRHHRNISPWVESFLAAGNGVSNLPTRNVLSAPEVAKVPRFRKFLILTYLIKLHDAVAQNNVIKLPLQPCNGNVLSPFIESKQIKLLTYLSNAQKAKYATELSNARKCIARRHRVVRRINLPSFGFMKHFMVTLNEAMEPSYYSPPNYCTNATSVVKP